MYTHILLICTHVLHTHMHIHTHKYTYICIFPVTVHCKDLGAAALLISMSTLSSQILVSKYHSLIKGTLESFGEVVYSSTGSTEI